MSYEWLYGLTGEKQDPSFFDRFPSRDEAFVRVKKHQVFDIIVVGGGIHGACVARLAAFNGLRTILLEKGDYASQTSSRSSKMIHGGLRYLEMLDFRQVFQGIRSRNELLRTAPHLVRHYPFLIPCVEGEGWYRTKLGLGLTAYDFLLRERSLRHLWIPSHELSGTVLPRREEPIAGCFRYTDAIANDARLVVEHIISARQEGAVCLNYSRVDSIHQRSNQTVLVGFTDVFTNDKYEVTAGIVVNCSGPWAPTLGRLVPNASLEVRYSRGSHLLFDRPWTGPALFLPLPEKGRYYFVWPHPAGTLVGTTEREVTELCDDPVPTKDEVDEILDRLAIDLPGATLDRSTLHYAFAGIRTLPARGSGSTSQLSRRHRWSYGQGVLSLIGGKLTTAGWTAEEGMRQVWSLCGISRSLVSLRGRRLPGAGISDQLEAEFVDRCASLGTDRTMALSCYRRLGAKVLHLMENEALLEPVGDIGLYGEIEMAIRVEQAINLEDILRRRLGTEYFRGHGIDSLPSLSEALVKILPAADLSRQSLCYQDRLSRLSQLFVEQPVGNQHHPLKS